MGSPASQKMLGAKSTSSRYRSMAQIVNKPHQSYIQWGHARTAQLTVAGGTESSTSSKGDDKNTPGRHAKQCSYGREQSKFHPSVPAMCYCAVLFAHPRRKMPARYPATSFADGGNPLPREISPYFHRSSCRVYKPPRENVKVC